MSETNRKEMRHEKWVIKIGSALLTQGGNVLAREALDPWVAQIAGLMKSGVQIVLVSSGAVSEGMNRLGWIKRPNYLHELQAAAAVGQTGLIRAYEERFQSFDIQTAQVLLVHSDLTDRTRYLNARQTIGHLLDLNVIPIVNENDTVATDEIRFGDNDTLAGLVANLIDADKLLILTDQAGVFDDDPRVNTSATLIRHSDAHDPLLDEAAKDSGGQLGRGGMTTKIKSARLAAQSSTTTIIADGREESIISRIAGGEDIGTCLTAGDRGVAARKQWLGGSQSKGVLVLDTGAASALKDQGVSLLAVGIRAVKGNFERGDLVSCIDEGDKEIARGLIAYSSLDVEKIIGQHSDRLSTILGYDYGDEVIHRNDLVLL